MVSNNDSYLVFTFGNPRQRWIYEHLLALLGTGSAAFYKDACWLMSLDPKIKTAVHIVGHLFRELEGQLRSLLLDQTSAVTGIQEKLSEGGRDPKSLQGTVTQGNNSVRENSEDSKPPGIPCKKKLTHQQEIDNILLQWHIPCDHPMARLWVKRSKRDPLHKFAHHRMLGGTRPSADDFETIIEEWEAVFEFILRNTETNYTKYHTRLDELLSKQNPTNADLQTLRESVPNSIHAMTYFFGRLSHPQWMEPLRAKGYFDGPADTQWDPEKAASFFPYWPQAQYLIRMAPLKPDQIMDILLHVQDKGNRRVQHDLIQAAMQMPAITSAKMVLKVLAWLQNPRYRFFTRDCADLVSYLATNEQAEPALTLATKLFAPEPFKTAHAELARDLTWDYGEGLKRCMPSLVNAGRTTVFKMLCDLLRASRIAEYGIEQEAQPHDLSHHDRPRLDIEPREGEGTVEDALISQIRDLAMRFATQDPTTIPELVRELEFRKWPIFYRLALYLLSQFAQQVPGLALARIKDFYRYHSDHYHNEYYALALAVFPLASAVDQGGLLIMICTGPNPAEIRALISARRQEVTADAVRDAADRWRRDRLGALRPVLNAPCRCCLQEFEERLGPAQSLTTLDRITIREHPPPEEAKKFPRMDVHEIITFLVRWGPSTEFPRQSPDPVFRGLQQAVASGPKRFAEEAGLFQQVDISYVRHFLQGLEEALTQETFFPWPSVIELCRWIIRQGLAVPGRTRDDFYWDHDWGYTRKATLKLIRAVFKSASNRIPLELRNGVWEILHTLSEDPEPSAEQEEERIGAAAEATQIVAGATLIQSHEDPITMASGTTRPQAIMAVIDYAVWVQRSLIEAGPHQGNQQAGLQSLPEVQQVLERHLFPDIDPSITFGSALGGKFTDLYDLDTEWTIANKGRIFPTDDALRGRREAAWEAFIILSCARGDIFEVLEAEYIEAVAALGTWEPRWKPSFRYPEHLGEHLWNLYISGIIQLGSHQDILGEFYERASDDLIGQLHWKLGRELHEDSPRLGETEFQRLEKLWSWRLSSLPDDEYGNAHVSECQAYGVWFSSGRFPYDESIHLLEDSFKKTGKVRPESSVMETLARVVTSMPEEVLRCGHLIVSRIEELWKLTQSKQALETILSHTIKHERAAVSTAAHELAALLTAKGLHGFAT